MWDCEVSIDIAVPIEAVFRYLSDFQRHKEWSVGVAELEQLTAGPVGVGSEFKASEKVPFKLTSFSRIAALDPPKRVAWEAWDNRAMRVQWEFDLSPRDGGTHVVERGRFQPSSILGSVMLALMRKRQIPGENRQSLGRIKAILEDEDVKQRAKTASG